MKGFIRRNCLRLEAEHALDIVTDNYPKTASIFRDKFVTELECRVVSSTSRACAFAAVVVALLSGCNGTQRNAIQGAVTLDDQPLDSGYITFCPLPGTKGPTAGANIVDGRFEIPADKGTFSGTFRVEISKYKEIPGRFLLSKGPKEGERIALTANVLPARYNTDSGLTAEIDKGNSTPLRFDLVSK